MPRWKQQSIEERFWSHVDRNGPNGCWVWTGYIMPNGYAQFGKSGEDGRWKNHYVHRLSYEFLAGKIPTGLHIDHLCRNRKCCNPKHLEPVTHKENLLRGETLPALNAAKTHCKNGHEFTPSNTYIYIENYNGREKRHCRTCRKAVMAAYKARSR